MVDMKKLILLLSVVFFSGCNLLSPRISPEMQQKLDNQNAKINGIENNQNAIKLELGRLSQDLSIQNSTIGDLQQGWLNFSGALSRNDNKGIQVLQGDGALILVFAITTIGMMLYYFYKSRTYCQAAKVLARQIVDHPDPVLHQKVLSAITVASLEKTMLEITKDF